MVFVRTQTLPGHCSYLGVAALLLLASPAVASSIRTLDSFAVPGLIASVDCNATGCPEYIWINTGFWVDEGDTLTIHAEGGIGFSSGSPATDGPDGQVGIPAEPHDVYYYVASNLNRYSLIGRIGDPGVPPSTRHRLGDPFNVGADLVSVADRSGFLHFSVNDSYFYDNSGEWVATASAQPIPEPSTLSLFAAGVAFLSFSRWSRKGDARAL